MSFCYIGLATIPTESVSIAQGLYFIAIIASAFNSVGYFKSVSISCGPYTAKIMTIISFLYSIVLTILPIIKYFVAGDDEPEQWQMMFYGAAAGGIICVIIYIFTVETNLRPWAEIQLKSRRSSLASSAQISRRPSLNSVCAEEEPKMEKKEYY
uniref:Uncharacterized protein n=1 Tax=Panagrolaimus davidi TaxID=227884 RepID=A0A914PBL2_9BILA